MTIREPYLLPDLLTFTKKLIAIPSVASEPLLLEKVLNLARQELQGYYPIEEFKQNGVPSLLVHNTSERTRHFKIILNAHLDVVPGTKEQFIPFEKDGRLYGRGAYDMKAAATTMIFLFKELAQKVQYPLALQLVTDEESFSANGTRYHLAKGLRGEFVITGENSAFEVRNKAKGLFWFCLRAKGISAHGGYPWNGKNALWILLDIVSQLKKLFPIPEKAAWVNTINLARIETPNTALNKVPDEAVAFIDLRYIPEEKEYIVQKIQQVLPEYVQMDIISFDSPMFTDEKNPYIQSLLNHIQQVTGKEGKLHAAHATSELRFYNDVGCPGVEFGIMGDNQHADNEWADITSIEQYYHVLSAFLLSCNKA